MSGKSIGLKQLANKKYKLVEGLPQELVDSIGEIEDSWDAVLWGESGSGKTNCTVILLKALLIAMKNAKAEYVSFEEGHGKTIQDLMIKRHKMHETIGGRLVITEHIPFDELYSKINRRQSAKIWVIDSIQASGFTEKQCQKLKNDFVLSKKGKIILYISWVQGSEPKGAVAQSVKYYANIKMYVDRYIMFPRSRYGGNKPFVIWLEGAKRQWGRNFYKKSETERPKKIDQPKTPTNES